MSKADLDWYWGARREFLGKLTEDQVRTGTPGMDILTKKQELDVELLRRDPIAYRATAHVAHLVLSELSQRKRLKREDTTKYVAALNEDALPLAHAIYDLAEKITKL
jgi:hypothetical protein